MCYPPNTRNAASGQHVCPPSTNTVRIYWAMAVALVAGSVWAVFSAVVCR